MEISYWLRGLGLSQYEQVFRENDVDESVLCDLTADDLIGMGVTSIGHRRKLLAAISSIRSEACTASEHLVKTAQNLPVTHLPPRPRLQDAERRQLTVMFVDLVGSTALSVELDPEEMRDIIANYQAAVSTVVSRYDGHVAKFMGDGVLCYFGWPTAHEEDAERAVHAGLAITEALRQHRAPNNRKLAARIGIATGLVVVGDLIGAGAAQEEAVVGETPNLAARLQSAAEPGEVVVAEATHKLLGELFGFKPIWPQRLKGLADSVAAYVVTGERSVESRFEARVSGQISTMVGREHELALVLERWKQIRSNEGQFVLLLGEAGIGKSRVVRATIDSLASEPHVRISYQCSPYHSDSALYPAIQQLTFAAGLLASDSDDDKLDKLEAVLAGPPSDRPLFAALLGIDSRKRYGQLDLPPRVQRTRTLEALVSQLMLIAKHKPVLFVIEDVHWIDATTLEMLDFSLDRVAQSPIMMLVTARPTFQHAFGGHPIVTKLALNRLGRDQAAAIVSKLTRGKNLPSELLQAIVARTDGVPLFVEEFTKTVMETGGLRETPTAFELTRPISELSIPSTLHDSLTARLDRQQPIKEVAQIASCIGREFDYRLLSAVSPLDDAALEDALERLAAAELIYRRGTPPEAHYVFKHALVRDAAYESLLRTRRQATHIKLVTALESSPETPPEILAHHASMAALTEKAAFYWMDAGRQATVKSANLEGIQHLSRALSAIEQLPECADRDRKEAAARSVLGTVLISVHGYAAPETGAAFNRARILSKRIGDRKGLYAELSGEFAYHFVKGDLPAMRTLTDEALATSEALSDVSLAMVAQRFVGLSAIHEGDLLRARTAFDTIVRVYNVAEHRPDRVHFVHDPKIHALAYLAPVRYIQGHADEAKQWSNTTIAYARELDHANMTVFSRVYGCAGLYELLGDVKSVDEHVKTILEISELYNLQYFRLSGLILQGWVMARQGRLSEGVALMRQTIQQRQDYGASWYQVRYLCMLAEIHLLDRNADAGLAVLKTAQDQITKQQEFLWSAEVLRLEGELRALDEVSSERATVCFEAALTTSLKQGAVAFALRAATSLVRTASDGDQRLERQAQLRAVLTGISEGMDAEDYVRANAVLR